MNDLKNKRVLVTGATGFIGGALVERLNSYDIKVSVLIRNKKDSKKFNFRKSRIFIGDLTDYKSLLIATNNIDIIFNVAGALPYHKLDDEEYIKTNVTGVENLMKAAIRNKIKRVVHVSTVGIYGNNVKGASEKTNPCPADIYARSKLKGEMVVKWYQNKLSTVIIRPTIAYGPGDTRPVILTLFRLINKNLFILIGNGKNYFHTVYIDNLVDALILAAQKKNADSEDFIIGDDPCPTFGNFCKEIFNSLNKRMPQFYIPKQLTYVLFFMRRKINFTTEEKKYDIKKARRLLGYNPKANVKDGVRQTLVWYKKKGLL